MHLRAGLAALLGLLAVAGCAAAPAGEVSAATAPAAPTSFSSPAAFTIAEGESHLLLKAAAPDADEVAFEVSRPDAADDVVMGVTMYALKDDQYAWRVGTAGLSDTVRLSVDAADAVLVVTIHTVAPVEVTVSAEVDGDAVSFEVLQRGSALISYYYDTNYLGEDEPPRSHGVDARPRDGVAPLHVGEEERIASAHPAPSRSLTWGSLFRDPRAGVGTTSHEWRAFGAGDAASGPGDTRANIVFSGAGTGDASLATSTEGAEIYPFTLFTHWSIPLDGQSLAFAPYPRVGRDDAACIDPTGLIRVCPQG